jgi:hypothetical protein
MSRRPFTVEEVEKLIPTLEKIFTQVLQLRAAMKRAEQKLEKAGARLRVKTPAQDRSSEPVALRQARAMFEAYYEIMSEQVGHIELLGGQVKDIDLGLVDFPGKRGNQEILLCWKLGEKSVGFWHTVEGGFSSRRPIDELGPREPSSLD